MTDTAPQITSVEQLLQYIQTEHAHDVYGVQRTIQDAGNKLFKKPTQQLEKLLAVPAQSASPTNQQQRQQQQQQNVHLPLPQYTVAYIELLYYEARAPTNNAQWHRLYQHQVQYLIQAADPQQLRLSVPSLSVVVQTYTQTILHDQLYEQGVRWLQFLINTLQQPHVIPHTFTVIHTSFALLVQKAHTYTPDIIATLKHSLYIVDTNITGKFSAEDILLYHYYSGNIYATTYNYAQAQTAYLTALQLPSQALSAIQIDSYKRYILVSLLHNNSVPSLNSRTTSNDVQKGLEQFVTVYSDLKQLYINGTYVELYKKIADLHDVLKGDRTLGLCQRLLNRFIVYNIQKLTKIYTTVSYQQVQDKLYLDHNAVNIEQLLQQCIEHHRLSARLDTASRTVYFVDPVQSSYDTAVDADMLSAQIQQIKELNARLQHLDHVYALHPIYLTKTTPELSTLTDKQTKLTAKRQQPTGMMDDGPLMHDAGVTVGSGAMVDVDMQRALEASKHDR